MLTLARAGDVWILRVDDPKLTYPALSSFFAEVRRIVDGGARKLVIDLAAVAHIDSPCIGCLMDIHRLVEQHGGVLKLAGFQPRVETLLSMTGVHKILDVHREPAEALAAFDTLTVDRRVAVGHE